jgi:diguanylate cyclase (GGDEF)-like protein/PAS domain S-box-containing protein
MAVHDESSLIWPAGESESFYKRVLDNLYDAVYFTDRQRRITYWNRAAEALTGFSAEETVGSCCADNLLMHVNDAGACVCTGQCPLSCTMKDRRPRQMDLYMRHKQGHRIPVSIRSCPLLDKDGVVVGAVEIFNDNSRQRATQEKVKDLAKLAFLDPVVQVANRRYAEQKLAQYLEQHEKYGTSFAVLMVDLDQFKLINDTYGHSGGDTVLIAVAKTLTNCLRTSDLVGRWGGDEFLALLPGMTGTYLADKAELCRSLVERSDILLPEGRVAVTISVGAAVVETGDTAESLLKRADASMYESKQAGRNRVCIGIAPISK